MNLGQTQVSQPRQVLQEVVDSGDCQIRTVREVDPFERSSGVECVEGSVRDVRDLEKHEGKSGSRLGK